MKNRIISILLFAMILSGCATMSTVTQRNVPAPKHIALLLPLQGPSASSGQSVRDGFLNAYYENLAKTSNQQTISFYDTSKNNNLNALYQQAVTEGADFVVGPLLKNNVESLNASTSFTTTTLELNYTENGPPSNVYQFGLSPLTEAEQMAEKAKSSGLSNAIIIAPQNEWGQRVSKALIAKWQSLGGVVADKYFYSANSNFNSDIAALLHIDTESDKDKMKKENNKNSLEEQRRQDFNVIFLLSQPNEARQIVPLLRFYYANNVPIYATSSISSGKPNPQKDHDLKGVIFCDIPWVIENNQSNRLFAVGRDAYWLTQTLPNVQAMQGATGTLTLNSSRKIERQVVWTTMR
jgi:outer membrane PBP1 activator LpoA protein